MKAELERSAVLKRAAWLAGALGGAYLVFVVTMATLEVLAEEREVQRRRRVVDTKPL